MCAYENAVYGMIPSEPVVCSRCRESLPVFGSCVARVGNVYICPSCFLDYSESEGAIEAYSTGFMEGFKNSEGSACVETAQEFISSNFISWQEYLKSV